MSDILAARNVSLSRLLAEFDNPPPVPPKNTRRAVRFVTSEAADEPPTPGLPGDLWDHLDEPSIQVISEYISPEDYELVYSPKKPITRRSSLDDLQERDDPRAVGKIELKTTDPTGSTIVTQVVTVKRKKVAFAQDDSGLLTPMPTSLQSDTFEDSLSDFELATEPSIFDPPQAPRWSRFPEQLPEVPKKKPAPLNLNRPTSHTGKWNVHRESEIWTPIDDEPDTASMISMDNYNAPKICPLPYKPVKSVPLRVRGSMRPAPLRIRKGVRFDTMKSPANLPLKSPAPFKRGVRFDNVKSPAVSKFRTPSTPYSNSQFQVLTPRRKRGVRFELIKSPAASRFKPPPTPYHQDSFQEDSPEREVRFASIESPAVSDFRIPPTPYHQDSFQEDSSEREVRFTSIDSPAASDFKIPPTPYYQASFQRSSSKRGVRFAALKSPTVSTFKTPPTPYASTSFKISSSPPDFSPVTPRAMHMTIPAIASDSPVAPSDDFHTGSSVLGRELPTSQFHHLHQRSGSQEMKFPPRTTSVHKRNNSLPQPHDVAETTLLPTSTFDENAVGQSTLQWLGMLPKPSYRVGQGRVTDRSKILGSYFHGSMPSF